MDASQGEKNARLEALFPSFRSREPSPRFFGKIDSTFFSPSKTLPSSHPKTTLPPPSNEIPNPKSEIESSQGPESQKTFGVDDIIEKYGVVKGSYEETRLPKIRAFAAKRKDLSGFEMTSEAIPETLEWGQILVNVRKAPISPADLDPFAGAAVGAHAGADGVGVVFPPAGCKKFSRARRSSRSRRGSRAAGTRPSRPGWRSRRSGRGGRFSRSRRRT